jgi:hypothetical protein
LRASGIDYFVGYLGAIDAGRLEVVVDAGLAFMPVTFADAFDGNSAVEQCEALALPAGCTVWLDIEGKKVWAMNPQEVIARVNGWADAVIGGGYMPGLYVGSPQPLTGDELYALHVVRYWKAPSRVIDRNGRVWDGPACGFCMYQCWPSKNWPTDTDPNRVFVDVDFIQEDLRGRLPAWVVA